MITAQKPSPTTGSILRVSDLVVEYHTEGYAVRAIDDLSFEASAGELVVLLGPSGSGKTSLLSCLAGILTPTAGKIFVGDTDVTSLDAPGLALYRRSQVGIVFQASNLIQSLSARENIATSLLVAKRPRAESMARADELLRTIGLSDRGSHRPSRLSGGQQARIALARGLAHDPPVLLADEPTANLDYVNAEAVITLLRNLRGEGRLIVVSTHDDRMVRIADRVIEMVHSFGSANAEPKRAKLKAGETIFEQGTRGELVYQIDSGTIEIVREGSSGSEHLATLGPGQYFGELGPLLGFPRSATAIAKTDATVTSFGIRHFREHIQPHARSRPETAEAIPPKNRSRKAAPKKPGSTPKISAKKTSSPKRVTKKTKAKSATAPRKKVPKPPVGRSAKPKPRSRRKSA
ncbi:MAG: ATP-binding cassette domain-containing protein [Actinomycetota bacterium]